MRRDNAEKRSRGEKLFNTEDVGRCYGRNFIMMHQILQRD